MATATEMTLALGRTVYGGDQSGDTDSDEQIEGRETRLSVTWRLTDEEQDLTLMASVLAEEAERALTQADRTVRKGPSSCECLGMEKAAHIENGLKPAADTERLAAEQQPATGEQQPATDALPKPADVGNGHVPGAGNQPASSCPPASRTVPNQNGDKAPAASGSLGNGSSCYPAYVPPITKPQQLAIQSHCARHGVADWELRRLLWEMFGKKEPRELNKDQAGELLTALQRDMLASTADTPAYAN